MEVCWIKGKRWRMRTGGNGMVEGGERQNRRVRKRNLDRKSHYGVREQPMEIPKRPQE